MSVEKSTIDRFLPQGPTSGRSARPIRAPRVRRAATRHRAPASQRATALPGSPLLRTAFGALERRAPALGGVLAERLWFRLPKPAATRLRDQRTPAGGEPFEVRWADGAVRGRVYGDWGLPTAYLVHGWGGWWQQLAAHVEPLVDAGLCVVAFDAPSHGGSPPGRFAPRSTTFVEMAEALDAVVADFGRPTVVVAHSAGAMSTMLAMQRPTFRPQALVLVAAPLSVRAMADVFSEAVGLGRRARETMTRRAERRVGRPMSELDLVALASAHTSLPRLLVVHDRDDAEAPVAGAVALTTAWHGARLMLTDGLGHRRVMWDPAVVSRVRSFSAQAADELRRSSR